MDRSLPKRHSRSKTSAAPLQVEAHPEGDYHIDGGRKCQSEREHRLHLCKTDRNEQSLKWKHLVLGSEGGESFETNPRDC
jgi:hypothetical protein